MSFDLERAKPAASPSLTPILDDANADLPPTSQDAEAPRRTSGLFNASDTDVTFISSDNVLFHIHRKNLETHACGFPPSDFGCTLDEVVPLTEDSATLELLFSFIYPRRHPDLRMTPFELLESLAEAAEKYEVFAAMNICEIRMRSTLPNHAQEIMLYAAKHGYPEIMGLAAPALLDIPLDIAVSTFPLSLIRPWVSYYESYNRTLMAAFTSPAIHVKVYTGGFGSSAFHLSNDGCTLCARDLEAAMRRVYMGLGTKRSIGAVEEQVRVQGAFSGAQHVSAESWLAWLQGKVGEVPGFETFL